MGLFSSKKKTYVATSVMPLFDKSDVPTMRKKNIIDSVINDSRLTTSIINNALDSFTTKAERAYRKAARGDYYYGTPSRSILNSADGKDILKNILETEHNAPIQFSYYHFAPVNNLHIAWEALTRDYGYDEFSNSLELDGTKYWVANVEGHINTLAITSDESDDQRVPDQGTLAVWDRHPQQRYTPHRIAGAESTPVWVFGDELVDGAKVYLVDSAGNERTLFFDTARYDRDGECFQAKYRYQKDGQDHIGFFTHEYGSGGYDQLDLVHEREKTENGTFFPVFLFRSRGQDVTKSDHPGFDSSVALARSMGLDYEYMAEQVNSNPEAGNLEQAALMMGVPAYTTDDAEAEYLFRFFDWIYKDSASRSNAGTGYLDNDRPGRAIRIDEKDFETTLSFSKLVRQYRTGAGKPGTYSSHRTSETRYHNIQKETKQKNEDGDYVTVWITEQIPYQVEILVYRKQVTTNSYQELRVENLKVRYDIYGSKGVTANVGSDKLLVPVDYFIAREMRYDKKERVYHTSLHFVFNSKVTVKVKWYQSGWFQVVLIIIAIVITVLSWGSDGGSAIGAALSAGAYSTAAILIISSIIQMAMTSLFMNLAMTVIVEELGAELGMVVAVVAFVAAVYGANTGADWSSAAMQASNNLANTSMTEYQKQQMAEYNEERQEFELLKETQLEELEEAQNLLQQYPLLDPRSFIAKEPKLIPGESPDSLYQRTVHVGNPGILQYDYIESYVELNTQLPTFNDLVGETFV